MYFGTMTALWLPLYLYLVFLVFRRYGWRTLWILLFAALLILASDQLANLAKNGFERFRPTHEPGLSGIHTVRGYTGGTFGFYSAHASNTMAVAMFVIIILKERYSFILPLMLLWSLFMSYTRIYLGVHYPGDMIAGMAVGGLLGTITGRSCRAFLSRF